MRRVPGQFTHHFTHHGLFSASEWCLWICRKSLSDSGEGGIRTPSEISTKNVDFGQGGAESGALTPESTSIDPALATIIDAWPMLPEAIRAGILALVRAAGG